MEPATVYTCYIQQIVLILRHHERVEFEGAWPIGLPDIPLRDLDFHLSKPYPLNPGEIVI